MTTTAALGPSRVAPQRRGTTLSFVLLALAVIALLVLSFTTASWQALRAATTAARGARARAATDDVLAQRMADWPADSVVFHELGVTRTGSASSAAGAPATWQVVRTHPLIAWLRVVVHVDSVDQGADRAVWLEPPALPLDAALATTGDVTGHDPTRVTAALVPFDTDRCDTTMPAGPTALIATSARGDGVGAWTPLPVSSPPPASWRALLDAAWPTLRARTQPRDAALLPLLMPTTGWQAARLAPSDSVLTGVAAWRGLLVVDGPLTLDGTLSVIGVLVVRGPMHVRTGALTVQGAVLVDDPGRSTVTLGGASTLTADRCAVAHALATVARPRISPLNVWHTVTW